jgi:hypothetical protein
VAQVVGGDGVEGGRFAKSGSGAGAGGNQFLVSYGWRAWGARREWGERIDRIVFL